MVKSRENINEGTAGPAHPTYQAQRSAIIFDSELKNSVSKLTRLLHLSSIFLSIASSDQEATR